jgi:hypothetical protein
LEEGEKEKSFSAIFSDILLYEILWFTEQEKDNFSFNNQEQFNILIFLAQHYDEMEAW